MHLEIVILNASKLLADDLNFLLEVILKENGLTHMGIRLRISNQKTDADNPVLVWNGKPTEVKAGTMKKLWGENMGAYCRELQEKIRALEKQSRDLEAFYVRLTK